MYRINDWKLIKTLKEYPNDTIFEHLTRNRKLIKL